jgi:hypothetical protein
MHCEGNTLGLRYWLSVDCSFVSSSLSVKRCMLRARSQHRCTGLHKSPAIFGLCAIAKIARGPKPKRSSLERITFMRYPRTLIFSCSMHLSDHIPTRVAASSDPVLRFYYKGRRAHETRSSFPSIYPHPRYLSVASLLS